MKKLPLLFIACIALFAGCNNDLDLTAPPQDIPVIYGVFSKQDTDHYLRVERGFIDESITAEELAQNPDNLIYPDATVRLEISDRPGEDFIFELVNGEEEGFDREEGFFEDSPNYLYKLSGVNFANAQVLTVVLERGDDLPIVESDPVPVVDNFSIISPNEANIKVTIRPDDTDFSVKYSAPNEAKIFDAYIIFHYDETRPNGEIIQKQLRWTVARNQLRDDEGDVVSKREGIDFFTLLVNSIEPELNVSRRFRKFSVEVVAGGKAFADYVQLTLANTGITSSQEVPNFSNIENGLGLVSSKFVARLDSVDMSSGMSTELKNGDLTRDLNFE